MSLVVANNIITIQNASNVTKFNSNDKLTYLKYSQTSSISVSGYSPTQDLFYRLGINDFLVLTIRINSCTGNATAPVLGKFIPANGSIIVNIYGRAEVQGSASYATCDTDVLSAGLSSSYLTFKINKASKVGNLQNSEITANLTYRAKIFGFL